MVDDTARAAPLLSGTFRTVLLLAFLGFGVEQIIRAVLPLMILARGGDAVLVGLLAGAFALPSVVFRPLVGRLADQVPQPTLLRIGSLVAAGLPLLMTLPGVAIALVARFVQGTAWAVYSVANQALMARVAPRRRRGEASGLYMTMPALATLGLPAFAVALYGLSGETGPLVAASMLGFGAVLVASRLPQPSAATFRAQPDQADMGRGLARFLEPSALPGTVMVVAFGSTTTLFSIFAPVYAAEHGVGLGALVLYYPLYGLAQALTLPVGGRIADRIGRRRSIALGTGMATAALGLAVGGGVGGFVLAAMLYAVASSLVNPAISAMTIERAPEGRLGSAIATYSIGYQVANGLSAVLWGSMISLAGYPWPFIVAAGFQLATLALSRRRSTVPQPRPTQPGFPTQPSLAASATIPLRARLAPRRPITSVIHEVCTVGQDAPHVERREDALGPEARSAG
jgi:MFS family permease